MYVVEFTLHAKPGHYSDVADIYSSFAADFLATHDALVSVMVVGDEADGTVRGIGVWEDRESADAVNSDPAFAEFNDAITPLLAAPAERIELSLVHLFALGGFVTVQNQRPTCSAELVESSPGVGECELGDDCPVAALKPDFFAYRDAHFNIRADWSTR